MHRFGEMPLNHLGLKVEYFDIQKPLPDLTKREDIRGILSWLAQGSMSPKPKEFIRWAMGNIKRGIYYVVMGEPGFYEDHMAAPTPTTLVEDFWKLLGIKDTLDWREFTYNSIYHKMNAEFIGLEYLPPGPEAPYYVLQADDPELNILWSVQDSAYEKPILLAAIHPKGAYVADQYAVFNDESGESAMRKWIINPFLFFERAFQTYGIPKPDASTLANRRIYYSHIDGDGWNNYTQIQVYNKPRKPVISAQVIYDLAISEYPDLPVTVAAIAADLDEKWVARKESTAVARKLFSLPHVEVGTHTYSHPFDWGFFEEGDAEKEIPFLKYYPGITWETSKIYGWFKEKLQEERKYNPDKLVDKLRNSYNTPRAFAKEPFDIEKEILGSVKTINQYAPAEKPVKIVMWSGNTSPFERAMELTRKAGLRNINGGDARFDKEYPSLAFVSPLARSVGPYQQIYASNSNENTYTDLWTGRFHGFGFLVRTIENTESPIRLKPFNVYYHMYSGEKQAALNALLDNLNHARKQKITPIETSHFSDIVNGFFETEIIPVTKDQWKIENRGALQTIRFDKASLMQVDFSKSVGVVGQKHYQGSLYVYLDQSVKSPTIKLKSNGQYWKEPDGEMPYLIDARWRIWNIQQSPSGLTFDSQGFGVGEMFWHLPFEKARVQVQRGNDMLLDRQFQRGEDGVTRLEIPVDGIAAVKVSINAI